MIRVAPAKDCPARALRGERCTRGAGHDGAHFNDEGNSIVAWGFA